MNQTTSVPAASQKSSDLLQREAAILTIKAVELRYGLKTCLVNKNDRFLLERLNSDPSLKARLEAWLSGDVT